MYTIFRHSEVQKTEISSPGYLYLTQKSRYSNKEGLLYFAKRNEKRNETRNETK